MLVDSIIALKSVIKQPILYYTVHVTVYVTAMFFYLFVNVSTYHVHALCCIMLCMFSFTCITSTLFTFLTVGWTGTFTGLVTLTLGITGTAHCVFINNSLE